MSELNDGNITRVVQQEPNTITNQDDQDIDLPK